MDETTTRDEQRERLDKFAQAPLETRNEIVPAAAYLPPIERHGAIKVEVARSLPDIRSDIFNLAQLLGERGFYSWRVRNKRKGTTELIEGVSIKGAMALMKAYGNCRVACPVIVDLGSHWRFHAVFVDYERGVEIERSFLQRKGIAGMGDDVARREDMAYQVGQSKAERNVITKALEIEADILLEECRRSIVDRVGKDVEHYRQLIVERAAGRGIELERIEAVAGRPAKDWVATDMVTIIGRMAAINDGMATVDETFPKLGHDETAKTSEKLDRLAAQRDTAVSPGGQAAASEQHPPPEGAAAATVSPEDVIFRLLRQAQDQSITVQQRLENLEGLIIALNDMLPGHEDFINTAVNTAAKVAKGELTGSAALKYLTGLVTP